VETAIRRVRRELDRIDLLIRREILRLRARYHLSLDEFRGLYVSAEQVDDLLLGCPEPFDAAAVTIRAEAIRAANERDCHPQSDWGRMAALFALAPMEQDLLFLTLAPELDSKYETLYGYLNNDISRKFATRDLARRLFQERGCEAIDRALAPGSSLLSSGLLSTAEVNGFVASSVLAGFILAREAPPPPPLQRVSCTTRTSDGDFTQAAGLVAGGVALILRGKGGAGRLAVAQAISQQARLRLLTLDVRDIKPDRESAELLSKTIALQARLENSALYLCHCDCWFDGDPRSLAAAQTFLRHLECVPLFIACETRCHPAELLGGRRALELPFPAPRQPARQLLWSHATAALGIEVAPDVIADLARLFTFTQGEIQAAAQTAADQLALFSQAPHAALFTAARAHSAQSLAKLAPKIPATRRWKDLVLPPSTALQIREVAAAIRNRGIVYDEWGVSCDAGNAGLNVLFSGASGTGKTMTAGIIAAECGLDLYRIDLAGVVSKYIGETEKNLDRIFNAACSSNAILFFDEADAIFGNRSEVQDAHDRYANIEVAYLLQKLENHDGVVILASNLPSNIDDAFTRRIQFHVEFPLPAENHRERLWRGMFPARAPVAPDVDFGFLARQFHLTGGQIRSISVDAAFLAAADGHRITMPLIIKAVARHLLKQGHVPAAHQFQEYFEFAATAA
jgi:hypothetical protein